MRTCASFRIGFPKPSISSLNSRNGYQDKKDDVRVHKTMSTLRVTAPQRFGPSDGSVRTLLYICITNLLKQPITCRSPIGLISLTISKVLFCQRFWLGSDRQLCRRQSEQTHCTCTYTSLKPYFLIRWILVWSCDLPFLQCCHNGDET